MRLCAQCGKQDQAALDYETPCKPSLCPPTADERIETHHDACPKVIHEVRWLYRSAKLVNTPKHPEGQLEPKWIAAGWALIRDGKEQFRRKMLCRSCIQAVYQQEARAKDYVKACKKAAGVDDQTYSQLLVMQSSI